MVAADGSDEAPPGALLPILDDDGKPQQFHTYVEAEKWLRANCAPLAGRVVGILQWKRKFSAEVRSEPQGILDEAPRVLIKDPGVESVEA